ncbi:hypothetical protein OEZ86_007037 [Tetradesmus obliquus]|nr:hypothetical protein OEZ86_007037 [Tetradesmus obliquus]
MHVVLFGLSNERGGMLADLLWSYALVGVREEALLAAAAKVLPQRSLSLGSDVEAQAKVLWGLRSLGYRDAELEAALAEIIPNVQELLEG